MVHSRSPGGLIAAGIVAALTVALVVGTRSSSVAGDVTAYWSAAERLRGGADLYVSLANVSAPEVYRYSAWFAAAWVPLTYLPRAVVEAGWIVLLLSATVASLWRAPLLVAAAITPLLTWSALIGNVHPLLIAALVFGHRRRSAPVWVGLAASLKVFPILYIAVFLGRRQWRAAVAAIVIAATLWAPTVVLDLGTYPTAAGGTLSVFSLFGATAYAAFAAAALAYAVWRSTWLAASVAVQKQARKCR